MVALMKAHMLLYRIQFANNIVAFTWTYKEQRPR